ncbi:MAG: N-acetylmuramoyl-L-alanine amidase [Betaproteobacteria bacterium]
MKPGCSRLAAATAMALAACAPAPVRMGQAGEWVPSPNFDERRPAFVVIHHTSSDTSARAVRILTDPSSKVSAHYVIEREGGLVQLVDERARAWHAGDSWWSGSADLNSSSVGIELVNNGEEPFAEPQIAALLSLLSSLREKYGIPAANYLGHGDIAPGRKVDPSRYFPWQRLAASGFGLWCEAPAAAEVPGLDPTVALRLFGYDISDVAAATAAFRRHFRGEERGGAALDEAERAVLACLVELKRR